MRDKMERFVLLPFSVGCVSESSIAVAVQQPRRSTPKSLPKNSSKTSNREDDEDSLSSHESMKNSFKFLAIPKPDISNGFNRLFKGFKNFSQLFAYKEEMEEMEREMEIGFPTDVKHVTHIGLDGSTTKNINNNNNINNNPMKGWDSLISPELLTTLPSVSLDQFELPQAQAQAQAQTQPQPLVKSPTAQTIS